MSAAAALPLSIAPSKYLHPGPTHVIRTQYVARAAHQKRAPSRVKFSRDDNTPSGTVQWSKPPAFNATWDTSPHSGTHRRAQIKSSQSVSHAGALGAEHAPRERARDLRRGPVQRPTRRPPRAADAAEQSRRRRADVGAAGVGLEPRPRDPREGPRRRRGAAVPGEHGTYI